MALEIQALKTAAMPQPGEASRIHDLEAQQLPKGDAQNVASDFLQSLGRIPQLQQPAQAMHDAQVRLDHTDFNSQDYWSANRAYQEAMMGMQVSVQHYTIGLELTSKVVEQGTGSVKTILQTQP